MSSKPRWVRLGVLMVVIVVLAGTAFVLFRLQSANAIRRDLSAGEKAYDAGLAALDSDPTAAADHFDEAALRADKALKAATERRKAQPKPDELAELAESAGRASWLRARAMRDKAFAEAAKKKEPLPLSDDTTTGQKFRLVNRIPDADTRGKVLADLRIAAELLKDDKEVLNEALRTEVAQPALAWALIDRFATALLKQDPDNQRALYVLARHEYEQPAADARGITLVSPPEEKRRRERMLRSLEYVEQLKKTKDYPKWRTMYLEARVRQWLVDEAGRKERVKEGKEQREKLQALVQAAQAEAKTVFGPGGEAPKLSSWDIEGIFGMQELAVVLAVQAARQGGGDPKPALAALGGMLDFCQTVVARKSPLTWIELATRAALAAMRNVEPLLSAGAAPAAWDGYLKSVQQLAAAARDGGAYHPDLYVDLARLLEGESRRAGDKDDPARREALRKQALGWVEDGLKAGEKAKLPPAALVRLNELAARLKMAGGAKRDVIGRHLAALREAKQPRATAAAAQLEGALYAREGRLDAARRLLEEALTAGDADQALRGHAVLGGLYLALGEPRRALVSLREADRAYANFDALPPWDKAWILEHTRSPDDVRALLTIANLDAAARDAVAPGANARDTIAQAERTAEGLIKKLRPNTPQQRAARLALARFRLRAGQAERAEKDVAALRKEYPDNVEVLRAEVSLAGQGRSPKEARAEADRRIGQFLKDNPRSAQGKLFWAEWLVQTGRAAEAVDYLRGPAAFPEKDERYKRVLAVALLARGDRDESVRLLRAMPRDPATDALLIRALSGREERDKALGEALRTYENAGLFLCMQAEQALTAGRIEQAARDYARAAEYTQVRGLANEGMLRALAQLAERHPAKARELATELIKQTPTAPAPYLAHAYASLLLNDVGRPADSWDRTRTMAAALNRWEQLQYPGAADVRAALVRGRLWLMANRPDRAQEEVVRALKLAPKDLAANALALRLAVAADDAESTAAGRKYLDVVKEAQPDSPEVAVLEAQLDRREGKLPEAVAVCEAALAKKPSPAVFAQLASLYREAGVGKAKLPALVARWRKELPGDATGAREQVRLQAESGKADEARQTAERVRDELVQQEKTRLARAVAPSGVKTAEWDDRQKGRLEQYRLALDFDLGGALLAGKAADEAAQWAERMRTQSPRAAEGPLLLAEVYRLKGDAEQAAAMYRQALERHPGHLMAGNNLAWLLATRLKQPAEARKVVERLRRGPHGDTLVSGDRLNADLLSTLGVVYTQLGGDAAAEMRDLFEAARQRHSRDPRVWLYLGHAYAALKDRPRAEKAYDTAIALAGPAVRGPLTAARQAEVLREATEARAKLKPPAR